MITIDKIAVIIKGGGDIGSGVVHRLFRCGFPVMVVDIEKPTAVRRKVSFCEAVYSGTIQIEGITAKRIISDNNLCYCLKEHRFVPVIVDSDGTGEIIHRLRYDLQTQFAKIVLVDATIAKQNLGTRITDADLVIGLGPGFDAGIEVHRVIETNRGQYLGRVIERGDAQADTGIPATVQGQTEARVIRAPGSGIFNARIDIGELITAGQMIGEINGNQIIAQISGIVRGLIKNGLNVQSGMKLGDIDPRGSEVDINLISDKARAISGGVIEAILSFFCST
jgi:xanthine dehydrogenase accessory factor